ATFPGDESAASERRVRTHSASPLWCWCESGIRLGSRSIGLLPTIALRLFNHWRLTVVNLESLVGDKQNRDVGFSGGAVFHDHAFRKPDEMPRTVLALLRDERPFEHEHAMGAGMGMPRIHNPSGISHQA